MRSPIRVIFSVLFLLFLLQATSANAAKTCIDWKRVFFEAELERLSKGKTVVVFPLTSQTKKSQDSWFEAGLRDFLIDLLQTGSGVRILSNDLAALAGEKPDFIISGSFQHRKERLRTFIALKNQDGKLVKQLSSDIPYPDHRDFFTSMAERATELFLALGVAHDTSALAALRDATKSTKSYAFYAQGKQLLHQYNPAQIKKARALFTKAKNEDIRSPLGYQGMIDTWTFEALVRKQERSAFGPALQQAETILKERIKLIKPERPVATPKSKPIKKEVQTPQLENRFLKAHSFFLEGMHSAQKGEVNDAIKALSNAVKLAPEDAVTWHQLARMQMRKGKEKAASQSWGKALSLNPCMEW